MDRSDADIGLLGIPFDGAASFRRGASDAPKRIRSLTPHIAPFTEAGRPLTGLTLRDYGDAEVDASWEEVEQTVVERARSAFAHPFSIFLGGDHSVTIPLVAGAREAFPSPLGILHLDAHLDLMDAFEGKPWSHACALRRALDLPEVDPGRCAAVGIRSWLTEELEYVQAHPELLVRTARDTADQGVPAIADAVCRQLAHVASLYVTLDIDILDPAFAPGTGTPEAGGLSTRDVLELLRVVFERLPVRALDIVEVSPPLDHSDITSAAAAKILYEAFGGFVARRASG